MHRKSFLIKNKQRNYIFNLNHNEISVNYQAIIVLDTVFSFGEIVD